VIRLALEKTELNEYAPHLTLGVKAVGREADTTRLAETPCWGSKKMRRKSERERSSMI